MTIELVPLRLPSSANASKFLGFGREVKGVNPGSFTYEEFQEIEEAVYKYDVLLFRDITLSPEQQYALVKAFDPESESYSHGNSQSEANKKSILKSHLTSIPRQPQVQLIGQGEVHYHEGLADVKLQHPSHKSFHKTHVSDEDEAKGITRFYRWHQDAALYDLAPPKVTSLYGISVPQGPYQTCRYDDGTGDELSVPLGATSFVSGKTMFDILPPELKSLAVRSKVKYAPYCFVWMAHARAHSTGLGMETEDLEVPLNELPSWEESKIQILPVLWKNPITGGLHLQISACGAAELLVDSLPAGATREGALYPDGAHITNLKDTRELLYKMQRPGIAPNLVYPHDWQEKDLILFHNRGITHSAAGAFQKDQVRKFHQCNLAASDFPLGPNEDDLKTWA
ncbi:hypothetical protein PILCRDRAFT_3048 [Piloderma croceum F 1598]|uniref:TauD/TfdA-like domain-containing protein n=1 Tax=Piloderma croceum (strain F 1598) TaxID=765440 RepID=A0A0C3GE17_PILCF|nr:hypothetical protein PILCRDRAFT_3048 [Piloderma croceum F 1598]